MSWESSIEYERLLNEGVRRRLGGMHSADIVLRSYDFAAIERLQSAGEWDTLAEILSQDADLLVEVLHVEVHALLPAVRGGGGGELAPELRLALALGLRALRV